MRVAGLDLVTEWKHGAPHMLHFQTHESIAPPEYRFVMLQ